ncbi:MAG: hypothetical protein ABI305_03220 [Tepidiformaceae bacterium]
MNENDAAIARRYGSLITVAAVVAGGCYSVALVRKSYWAIAVPVTLAVGLAVAVGVALGRLLMTTPDNHDESP